MCYRACLGLNQLPVVERENQGKPVLTSRGGGWGFQPLSSDESRGLSLGRLVAALDRVSSYLCDLVVSLVSNSILDPLEKREGFSVVVVVVVVSGVYRNLLCTTNHGKHLEVQPHQRPPTCSSTLSSHCQCHLISFLRWGCGYADVEMVTLIRRVFGRKITFCFGETWPFAGELCTRPLATAASLEPGKPWSHQRACHTPAMVPAAPGVLGFRWWRQTKLILV